MNLTKIKPKYIYFFFLCLMIGVFLLSYSRYKMHLATMESGERLQVRISDVVCAGNRENQNYFVFRGTGGNEIVNVGKQACGGLQIGDTVEVLYNKDWDLYFPTVINTSDDKWGMAFGVTFILISAFYLIFPKMFKRK